MNQPTILPDTALTAIVRNEMVNPAGGIVSFAHNVLPHVEEAVIVDTGSTDGTRQALEELRAQYPQLKVYDRLFRGFSDARNFALKKATAKRALVLDADERIAPDDYAVIRDEIGLEKRDTRWMFEFIHVAPGTPYHTSVQAFRLFARNGTEFAYEVYEELCCGSDMRTSSADIYHYLPFKKGHEQKRKVLYNPLKQAFESKKPRERIHTVFTSLTGAERSWKETPPHEQLFYHEQGYVDRLRRSETAERLRDQVNF